MVGCTNPKVPYERAIIDVAQTLIENNVLILTNGCASFPLMKLGFCQKSAYKKAGASLRAFLEKDELPPVWHVGECIDNTRSSGIFAGIAGVLGKNLYELPLAFTSPEWANEKGVDASLGFRLMGIDSYHCVEYQIHGSANIIHFFKEGTRRALGSVMRRYRSGRTCAKNGKRYALKTQSSRLAVATDGFISHRILSDAKSHDKI